MSAFDGVDRDWAGLFFALAVLFAAAAGLELACRWAWRRFKFWRFARALDRELGPKRRGRP